MNETEKLVNRFAGIVLKAQAEQTASCEVAVELALTCKEAGLKFTKGQEFNVSGHWEPVEEIELEE